MDWYAIFKDFAAPAVGLSGVIVTAIFACAGLRTFDRWKREKLEEKRIDVAIDALAIGHEAQLVFDGIRSRFVSAHEYADMKDADVPAVNDHLGEQKGLRAILRRVEDQNPFFARVSSLEPKFVAVFGKDKDTIFKLLFFARQQVITTAQVLIDDYRLEIEPENLEGRNQRVKWRKQIFASPGVVDPEDQVGKLLQQFRDEIEQLCRPIIDRSFK